MTNKETNVLIVDELSNMRKVLRGFLRNLGFKKISEAEDGSAALSILKKKNSFDLVISDWKMPNMNGLELLEAIRSDDKLKGVLFLLVTAEAKKENIIAAIKAGANNYILKPFTEEILQEKLEENYK